MDNIKGFNMQATKTSLPDWLLFFACVTLFVLVPLLFAWNSMSLIHNHVYGTGYISSEESVAKNKPIEANYG